MVDCCFQLIIIGNSYQEGGVFFLFSKDKEIIVWMIGSVIRLLFFPYLKGEKEGKRGVEKPIFYNFFNFIYSKISKKIGFRGSAFPFPPFSLEGGKKGII